MNIKRFTTILAITVITATLTPAKALRAQQKVPRIYQESYALNGQPVYYFGTIDQDPTFKNGGMENFKKWFRNKRDKKPPFVSGLKVRITFIVDTSGKVNDLNIEVASDYEKEILEKVLKKIPDWTPGIHNGQPVNTLVTYNITYIESASE